MRVGTSDGVNERTNDVRLLGICDTDFALDGCALGIIDGLFVEMAYSLNVGDALDEIKLVGS